MAAKKAASPRLLQSMTGFARHEGTCETDDHAWRYAWEVRSVNNRGLDIRCRLPSFLDSLEMDVRKRIPTTIARGSVTASLQLRGNTGEATTQLSEEGLDAVLTAMAQVQQKIDCAAPRPEGILALLGVLVAEDPLADAEALAVLSKDLLESFDSAMESLVAARAGEGKAVIEMISEQINEIENLTNASRAEAETLPEVLHSRMKEQVAALIGDAVAEDRLAQEVALLVVKGDVREELDRLDAHIVAARELLSGAGPIGRKLDFLTQEFNREANTLCSKAQSIDLRQLGLSLKTTIDQMREQLQNLE